MRGSCFSVGGFMERRLLNSLVSAGFEPETFQVDDHSQTTLHCWVPKNGGNKPALVLIHGFGPGPIWQWHTQVQALSIHFDLYLPSLLFFSPFSATASPHRSDVFQAECVAGLMSRLGVDKFSIIGTSYGGFVAYHLARLHPDRVVRVVLASSAVNRRPSDVGQLLKAAVADSMADILLPRTPEQFRVLLRLVYFRPPPPIVPDFLFHDFIQALFTEGRQEKMELLKEITLGKEEQLNITPLAQEVLIVWGKYDQIFPIEKAYELQKLIGNNVKLEVIDKASHVPQLEKPSIFYEIVKRFLLDPPERVASGATSHKCKLFEALFFRG